MKRKYFNPCKKCLVQACCSVECNDSKLYRNSKPYIVDLFAFIMIATAVWTLFALFMLEQY